MPSRGTPRHAIRVPDELWQAGLTKARAKGETLNAVIRRAIEDYVQDDGGSDEQSSEK